MWTGWRHDELCGIARPAANPAQARVLEDKLLALVGGGRVSRVFKPACKTRRLRLSA